MSITSLLPKGRMRGPSIAVLVALVTLIYTQILLPGTGGAEGTPAAMLFLGLVHGCLISLTAASLVLVYRTLRIINFAQTAIGTAGAVLLFDFVRYTSMPFPIAFALAVALGGLVGVVFDLIFGRRFFRAPRLVLTVVTIAAAEFISSTANSVRYLPFFPRPDARAAGELNAPITKYLPLRGMQFEVGGFPLKFSFEHVFAIEMSLLMLFGLFLFFRFTRAGVAVRAMAENTERASLLGISVGGLSTTVWVAAGLLSAASVSMTGMISGPGFATGIAPGILLPALAAAVIGRLRSIPITVVAAILISVIRQATENSLGQNEQLADIVLFAMVVVGFLVVREKRGRSEAGVELSWDASEERRPIPTELGKLGVVRNTRAILVVVGLAALGVFPYIASVGAVTLGAGIALGAITVLSLVVLTGWAGQVSLGQMGFVAVGAVIGGDLTAKLHIPFWFAVPIAAALTGVVAVLVGLPALRIKGLFLGVATFAFTVAVHSAVSNDRYFGGLMPKDVDRPTLFFLNFQDERSMYFLCVACLVLALVIVNNLRKSRVGRIMIAVRENEANLQTFGVRATRTKLLAFGISGALAGFAGAVYVHQLRGMDADVFGAAQSVEMFVYAVIGGINSPVGALLGSAYGELIRRYFLTNQVLITIAYLMPLVVLYAAPGGIVALITNVRDAFLRIIAQRRGLVVPSLFEDVDPEIVANRLIPLAAPVPGSGLNALAPDARFAMASDLYRGRGERIKDRLAGRKETKEAALISSAARQADEADLAGRA